MLKVRSFSLNSCLVVPARKPQCLAAPLQRVSSALAPGPWEESHCHVAAMLGPMKGGIVRIREYRELEPFDESFPWSPDFPLCYNSKN